jgi:hypothetical protein
MEQNIQQVECNVSGISKNIWGIGTFVQSYGELWLWGLLSLAICAGHAVVAEYLQHF